MRKSLKFMLGVFVMMLVLFSAVSAFDIQYTQYTYARDSHPNVAYYEGFVGVRGADWIKQGMYW